MTVELLNSIADEYNVIRGLDGNERERLRDILNEEAEDWPDGLKRRADRCIEIMRLAKLKGCFSGDTKQISAITKLMWFVRPEDWTMCGSFAAAGLNVRGKTVERMERFYEQFGK